VVADHDEEAAGGDAEGVAAADPGQPASAPQKQREARRGREVAEERDVRGGDPWSRSALIALNAPAQTTTTSASATWPSAVDSERAGTVVVTRVRKRSRGGPRETD